MKLGAKAENPLEQVALTVGIVPTPLLDTIVALLLARSVMVGVKLGIFEALSGEPLPAAEVAARCGTDLYATEKLLGALAGTGYLDVHSETSGQTFALASAARRWLLKESAKSLHDAILYQFVDATYIERIEDYVRTGRPLRIHEQMRDEQWELYQRGMRAGANLAAPELALRIPVPATPLSHSAANTWACARPSSICPRRSRTPRRFSRRRGWAIASFTAPATPSPTTSAKRPTIWC